MLILTLDEEKACSMGFRQKHTAKSDKINLLNARVRFELFDEDLYSLLKAKQLNSIFERLRKLKNHDINFYKLQNKKKHGLNFFWKQENINLIYQALS